MRLTIARNATIFDGIPVGIRADGEVARERVARKEGGVHRLVSGMTGAGKATKTDTPVPTPTGWTTMGDLRDGDLVYDDQGQTCRVVTAWPVQHGRPCYDVAFSDGSVITADADHLWDVETRSSRSNNTPSKVLSTAEMVGSLRAGTRPGAVNYSVRVAGPLAAPEADLPVDPYTLGMWLGDGNTHSGRLTLNRDDAPEIETNLGYPYRRVPSADRSGAVGVRVEGLTTRLRHAGVLGDKHIPLAYLRASEQQRRALLAGLLDSDGYATPHGGVVFAVTLERLARDTRSLIATLGYKSSLNDKPAVLNSVVHGTAWIVSFTPPDPVFRVTRKGSRQVTTVRASAGRRFITEILPVPSAPVRCITVDSPTSLYLVGDQCITTHNSYGEKPVLLTCGALQVDQIMMDPVKGIQSYGSIAGCLQMYEIDRGRCIQIIRRLLEHTLPARTNHLAREGLEQWAPTSTLRFLRIHIEEAWKFAQAETLVGLGVALRSAGGQLTLSLQQPTFDQMPTTLRNQMGAFRCYGLADDDYAIYSLPEDVVAAGARPAQWGNDDPGMHYLVGPKMTIKEKTMPVRSFSDATTPGKKFADAAAFVHSQLGKMDTVTMESLGDLWETHIAPVELVKKMGVVLPGAVGAAALTALTAIPTPRDAVAQAPAAPAPTSPDLDDDDPDGMEGDGMDYDPDDPDFQEALAEFYGDDEPLDAGVDVTETDERIQFTTDDGDDFVIDLAGDPDDPNFIDPNEPMHPTVVRMIGDPPKDGISPEEFRELLNEIVTAFVSSERPNLPRSAFVNVAGDCGWAPSTFYKWLDRDPRLTKGERGEGWIRVAQQPVGSS